MSAIRAGACVTEDNQRCFLACHVGHVGRFHEILAPTTVVTTEE